MVLNKKLIVVVKVLLIFAVAVGLTLLFVSNNIFPLNGLTSGDMHDDTGCAVWNFYIVNELIKDGNNPFRTDKVFYPVGANLAHHGLVSGLFPVAFIADNLTGGSLYYPFYAYHISILLSFPMLLLFSYLTLHELGYRGFPSVVPVIAYSFCAFYVTHALALNHIAGYVIPMNAFLLIRLFKRPTLRNALFSAVALSSAVYFTEFALFVYVSIPLLLAAVMFYKEERRLFIDRIKMLGWMKAALMLIVFIVIISPFLSNFLFHKVMKPLPQEYTAHSANIIDFFIPRQESTPLYGTFFSAINAKISAALTGHETFIGYPLVLSACMSFFSLRRNFIKVTGLMALIFFTLSLGPNLKVMNGITEIHLPCWLLMHVPPFVEFRTPVRFIVIGMFFLMIMSAEGLDSSEKILVKSIGKRFSIILMSLLLVWTIAESYRPAEKQKVFQLPPKLEREVNGLVLNLPLNYKDCRAVMLQTIHKQPIGTGYLSRLTDANISHFKLLQGIFDQSPEVMCEKLKVLGYRNIIISDGTPVQTVNALSGCAINTIDLRKGQ